MDWLHNIFHKSPEIALFLSLAVGYYVGQINFGKFQLGGGGPDPGPLGGGTGAIGGPLDGFAGADSGISSPGRRNVGAFAGRSSCFLATVAAPRSTSFSTRTIF